MSTPTDEGLARLAAAVRSARVDHYSSTEKAGHAAGMSRSTWESVEKGRPGTDRTYRLIERALGWDTGRTQRILSGEDAGPTFRPTEIEVDDPHVRAVLGAMQVMDEAERRQAAAVVEAIMRAARKTGAAGNAS